jgi:hypothetical protein
LRCSSKKIPPWRFPNFSLCPLGIRSAFFGTTKLPDTDKVPQGPVPWAEFFYGPQSGNKSLLRVDTPSPRDVNTLPRALASGPAIISHAKGVRIMIDLITGLRPTVAITIAS